MTDFLMNPITAGFIIPFIMEGIKKALKVKVKFLPLLAFAIGAVYGVIEFYVPGGSTTMVEAIITGITAGGVATGLYDIKKKAIG